MIAAAIERSVVDNYLASSRFNGAPYSTLAAGRDLKAEELDDCLAELIQAGRLSLTFGDIHPNPHIQAFAPHGVEKQVELLRTSAALQSCAYPTLQTLQKSVVREDFDGRPFSLRLALGEPQLVFELTCPPKSDPV
jgi:hypothetical protein